MKLLILLLAAAGLSGCAVYPATGYDGYGYGNVNSYGNGYDSTYPVYSNSYPYGYGAVSPVVVPPPVYIYGSGVYGNNNGYRRPYPYARPDARRYGRPDGRPDGRPPGYAPGYAPGQVHGDRRPQLQQPQVRPGGGRGASNPWSDANRTPQPPPRSDAGPVRRLPENGWGDPGRR